MIQGTTPTHTFTMQIPADTIKRIRIVYAQNKEVLFVKEKESCIPTSIDTDGSIYNGVGYKDGYRLSSSGGVSSTAVSTATHTGFIKFKAGEILRVKIVGGAELNGAGNYVNFYGLDFGLVKMDYPESYKNAQYGTWETLDNGDTLITLTNYMSGLTVGQEYYIRVSLNPVKGANLIITVNEEIE